MYPYGHWLQNVSYKDLKLELTDQDFIHPRRPAGFAFIVWGRVPDRNNPSIKIKVAQRWDSFYDLEEEEFYRFVHRAIRDFEYHEVDEFFLVKGQRIYDPHKNDAKPI